MRELMKKDSMFYLQKEIWEDIQEYREGFKEVIRMRELTRIPFLHQSPQFAYRPYLVEYIKKLCIDKKISHCCLHLAVYLLDIFMDNHSIKPDRVLIVANVCLLLAAKFEESTKTVPKISELNLASNSKYPLSDYRDLELVILQFFHWYLIYPTAAHYTYYYMQVIICYEDLKVCKDGSRTLFYSLFDTIAGYLDHIIDDIHYMQTYKPSRLAAAIIAASRSDVGLREWTEQLEKFTDYNRDDLKEPINSLMNRVPCTKCQKCDTLKY